MIETFSRVIVKRSVAIFIVVAVLLFVGVGVFVSYDIPQEDDILAFLPAQDPDVKLFYKLNERFGGLQVALVGIETKDVFTPDFLQRVQQATKELKETKGLESVLSFTNVLEFAPDLVHGGIVTGPLVRTIPKTEEEIQELRSKIMSKDYVVENFVSGNGKAVLLYGFLSVGSDQREVCDKIKSTITRIFSKEPKFWGGGPFVSAYIYDSTQQDMRRLTPWAVVAMLAVMMFVFRDIVGTSLVLLSTSFGIVCTYGLMALAKESVNLVLGSMPVILFAVGSAYGTHVLARYYKIARHRGTQEALIGTLTTTGPTVITAGLTTVVSLFSFMAMDIRPMRVFGLYTGLGVLATLILSLTFIPAVISLLKLKGRQTTAEQAGVNLLVDVTRWFRMRPGWVGSVLFVITVCGIFLLSRIDSRIETTSLFSKGSPPDLADKFLLKHFGGSQFLQIQVTGDMTDPAVLRQVQWMADSITQLPRVSSVMHIGDVLSRANEAMEGQRRIPDTTEKVKSLYSFMVGDSSIKQLITDDRKHTLINVKALTRKSIDLEGLLQDVEFWIGKSMPKEYGVVKRDGKFGEREEEQSQNMALTRIATAFHVARIHVKAPVLSRVKEAFLSPNEAIDPSAISFSIKKFLRSEECMVELSSPSESNDPAQNIAEAVASLGPTPTALVVKRELAKVLEVSLDDSVVDDLMVALETPIKEIWQEEIAKNKAQKILNTVNVEVRQVSKKENLFIAIKGAVLDLMAPTVFLPKDLKDQNFVVTGKLETNINGMPVINRSLSKSALANQIKSLSFALVPVLVIVAILFRSLRAGILVSVPALITLIVIYAGMGLLGIHLDIGTAMLACIILGAGVDYAVHLVAEWHCDGDRSVREAAYNAVRKTGGAIWTNAIMVCTGFAILTLGEARPLQNVGGLTATAMIAAACATFIAIPALAKRPRYGRLVYISDVIATKKDKFEKKIV